MRAGRHLGAEAEVSIKDESDFEMIPLDQEAGLPQIPAPPPHLGSMFEHRADPATTK